MKTTTSERGRRIVVRASAGERLPEALLAVLREERVTAGWIQGSGVLTDVELRVFSAEAGGLAATRRLSGAIHVLTLEGSVGVAHGEPSIGLRAVLARETDRGMETLAGELVGGSVVGFEALLTALDDVAIGRSLDRAAGVVLIEGDRSGSPAAVRDDRPAAPSTSQGAPERSASPEPPAAWAEAVRASDEAPHVSAARASGATGTAAIPPRPVRVQAQVEDSVFPEAGDVVEHFAFGRCDVLKSDGDRLHLKVGKDGRIREIALEMLRVTELDSSGAHRRFKLDRKL